jgi:hypothetical protein
LTSEIVIGTHRGIDNKSTQGVGHLVDGGGGSLDSGDVDGTHTDVPDQEGLLGGRGVESVQAPASWSRGAVAASKSLRGDAYVGIGATVKTA